MMGESGVDSFSIGVMIRGYHVYQEIWDPVLEEELTCKRETVNRQELSAWFDVPSTENFHRLYFRGRKQIREIRENLLPRKFSTVRYYTS